jgi:di/tricarboxylate transporter
VSDAALVYVVLAGLVVLFVWNRLPVEIVALAAPLTLLATGVLSIEQTFAGFGDPTVIFIAALFIVSASIDSTGVTTWAGQRMVEIAGKSQTRLVVVMMLIVALLTALIGVNGAVAALLPMVVVVAVRLEIPASKLLMPLAFGAHAGSQLALTGTPIHILVSDAAVEAGEPGFGYFDFTPVGIPLVAAAIAIVLVAGKRLLPDREPERITPDLSGHARTLIEQYGLGDWVAKLEIPESSALIGVPANNLVTDMQILDVTGRIGSIDASSPMPAGAVITVRGTTQQVDDIVSEHGLIRRPYALGGTGELLDRRVGVVELVIPPRSPIVGEHVFPGETTSSGDFVVLAVQRQGENIGSEGARLAVGDTVLLQGTWDALDRFDPSDALVVDDPGEVRRQSVPLGPGSRRAILCMLGMVVLLATGVVSPAVAAVLAVGALVLTRVMTVRLAYRSVNWTIVVMVAALIPVADAVEQSGVAAEIAGGLVDLVGGSGPYALLLGLFVITAVFGQLISNTATALIMIPIATTAAIDFGISVRPVMMSLTIAAAAAFLTPIATAANLMVMEPAGYKFADYWRLGLLMLLFFMAASVLLVPVFWPF